MVTKIHHAAVDGASAMRFFATLMDADNRGTPLVPLEPSDEEAADLPPVPQLLRRALRNNLGSPLRIAETLMRSSPGLYRAAQTAVARREETEAPGAGDALQRRRVAAQDVRCAQFVPRWT
jgi:diacylglycerol O-acyltransferase